MTFSRSIVASTRFFNNFPKKVIAPNSARCYSHEPCLIRIDRAPGREQIGYSFDTGKDYYDCLDYPCPSVRYRVDTPEVKKLREKEKGDWKSMTIAEKKLLYRTSFRLTLHETMAPTNRMKSYLGWTMIWIATGIWLFMAFNYARNRGTYRKALRLDYRQAQLQRMIAMRAEPITGISSKWDYEKDDWKK